MNLTAENLDAVMMACLYRPEEIVDRKAPADAVKAASVVATFYFHPERLEARRADVVSMLRQLPKPFRKDEGGGWSFLNACVDRHGEQWGEHAHIDALFALAIALGLGTFPLERGLWVTLPGGMPFFTIDLPPEVVNGKA